ncbi:MAG: hypothetical protein KA401_00410 [Anaerolineae bacterium]|nr:hypothetical protein [Chloroflexota bacterium]MBP6297778.1 hypothetical protein [Anaerolineae bacterium]
MSEITRGVGYNWSLSYSSPALRQHMENYIRDCKPAAMLLFDRDGTEQAYAKELDRKYGWREDRTWGTMFTYRMWMPAPGSNDGDNTQLWLDPVGMVERHMGLAGSHVRFLTNNEPNHSDLKRTCDWHIAVMREAKKRGLRCAVGGYSYGHPENHLDYSVFDDMVREIVAGDHILDLHEYVLGGTVFNDISNFDLNRPETWPAAVPKEQRWRLGRFIWWMEHLQRRGIKLPKVVIGEWGWATRPGNEHQHEWIRNTMNAWQVGDKERSMSDQLKWAWNTLYKRWPNILGICLFTINDGGQWDFSNYLQLARARAMMRQGFNTVATTPIIYTGYAPGLYTLAGDAVKVRSNPNTMAQVYKIVQPGEVVEVLSEKVNMNGVLGFQQVKGGWMALHGGTWKLKALPAPEPVDREAIKAEIIRLVGEL